MRQQQRELRTFELLGEALELQGGARQEYLDRIGANDPELRRELETLLDEEEAATGDVLETTPFDRARQATTTVLPVEPDSPLPPSARFAALEASQRQEIAELCGLSEEGFKRRLSGDLDSMIGRETDREVQQQLRSPTDREADLRAHLTSQSTLAPSPNTNTSNKTGQEPPSFAQRHRVTITAVALVVLSAGVVASLAWQRPHQADVELEQDPGQADSLHEQSELYIHQGDFDAAEPLVREALALRREYLGEDSVAVADTHVTLGRLLYLTDRFEESATQLDAALSIYRRHLGKEDRKTGDTLELYGSLLIDRGQPESAQFVLRESLKIMIRLLGEEHLRVAEVRGSLGEALTRAGDFAAAESVLLENHHAIDSHMGKDSPMYQDSTHQLAALYEAWGRPEEAAP